MIAVEIALGAVMVSLLRQRPELLRLAPHGLHVSLDLVLLCAEPLLQLHLVALAVPESP